MKHNSIPHCTPILRGTIARLAIQCICPDTGAQGSFLFTGESHHQQLSRVTPVFDDLAELFPAVKVDWEEVRDGNAAMGFLKR